MATDHFVASYRQRLLLNPGPVTLSRHVRAAMLRPDLCHRQAEYSTLQQNVRRSLATMYSDAGEDYEAILIGGSGTAAVEAMIGSLVPRDEKSLVLANGVYGERMETILRLQGKPYETLSGPWLEPLDLEKAEDLLRSRSFSHVLTVHHETTTGRLNDLTAVVKLCEKYGAKLLLDAVSSFGGESLDFSPCLAALASTANKCLHGAPGVSFVLSRKDLLATGTSHSSSLYLDLLSNYQAQMDGYPQFTPPVQAVFALDAALEELQLNGGWRQRRADFLARSKALRTELMEAGFETLIHEATAYSSSLTSYRLPHDVSFRELYEIGESEGFVIYPGQQTLAPHSFRVAVMGDLSIADMVRFANAVRRLAA